MLETEQDHGVLQAILVALSHHGRSEAVGPAFDSSTTWIPKFGTASSSP